MRRLLLLCLAAFLITCGGSDRNAENPEIGDKIDIGDDRPAHHRTSVPGDDDDDDDDDGLEIEGLRGKLEPYDIQAGIEPHSGALSNCYHKRIRKIRYVGGKVELKFEVKRDGSVLSVQMITSSLGAWPIEKCLLETSRRMKFVKPKGGIAEFTVPLDFTSSRSVRWLGDARGELEVEESKLELQTCADEASTAQPDAVLVTLYVANRGVVKSVGFSVKGDTALPDEWADCAEAKAKAWTLTDPRGKITKLSFVYNP